MLACTEKQAKPGVGGAGAVWEGLNMFLQVDMTDETEVWSKGQKVD